MITDNNPLCHLFTVKLGAIEQIRVAQLSIFDFKVKYRPGHCNATADTLSRQPSAGELDRENAEYDHCVAICNVINKGTPLQSDLATAEMKCCEIRWICALEEEVDMDNMCELPRTH